MHLLIPFACSDAPACVQALASLRLPHLEQLLRHLALADSDTGSPHSLTPPHERALARLYGMNARDGCVAWAAREVARAGREPGAAAWGWITPAHWEVGADQVVMEVPHALGLDEPESRALLEAMRPYFAEDGITLEYAAPQRWLACGAVFAGFPSAALDRVAGREISAWMPSVASLRRLQNEMQMLLYTHPVNDARSARGLGAVNSFWVSGTGSLPRGASATDPGELLVVDGLRDAALANDWQAWARVWEEVDRNQCRTLLAQRKTGGTARLTLCGERGALRFEAVSGGWVTRLRRRLGGATLQAMQDRL